MMTHSIVYIILSVRSLVAVHAMSEPLNPSGHEQHEVDKAEEDSSDAP